MTACVFLERQEGLKGGPFSGLLSLIFLSAFLFNVFLQSSINSLGESVWFQPVVTRQQKPQPGELQVKLPGFPPPGT